MNSVMRKIREQIHPETGFLMEIFIDEDGEELVVVTDNDGEIYQLEELESLLARKS